MNIALSREYKALAGITAVMFGVAQSTVPFIDVGPMLTVLTGGILAYFGGIYIMDQVQEPEEVNE